MSNVGANLNANQGSGTVNVDTDRSKKIYIVPFIADMAVDANATIAVTQQADVTITNIDALFDASMNLADSVAIMNAFSVIDSDFNGTKNATDASSGSIVNVAEVGTERGDALWVAIRHMLDQCLSAETFQAVGLETTDVNHRTLKEYIRYQGYSDTKANLMMDTLAGFLEASDLNTFEVTVDASGGSFNMVELMSDEPQTHNNLSTTVSTAPQKYRRSILTQLPESNIEKYIFPDASGSILGMEDIDRIEFMPMMVDDKLVFVFDLTLGEVNPGAGSYDWAIPTKGTQLDRVIIDRYSLPQVALAGSGVAATNTLGGVIDLDATKKYAEANVDTLLITRPTKRRIAIRAKMSTIDGAGDYASTATQAFHIEDKDGNVFNPNHPDFRFASAAGLLGTVSENKDLKTTTAPWAFDAPTVDVSSGAITSASFSVSDAGDVSSGVIPLVDLFTVTETGVGAWVVVNNKNNKNVFSIDTTGVSPVVRYSGKTVATADKCDLYRVTNFGKSVGIELTGSASIQQD
jgi:hypothetical protein